MFNKNFYEVIIRIVNIAFGIILGIISTPIILITALCIKLESGGPIFFTQKRLGKNGKEFVIYKIRSMVIDAEKDGVQWASKNDPRITKVGRFIRKTRIDELPQFINILKGDMNLIGPRPETPELTYEFNKDIPNFTDRLLITPGLTGWAQINGGYDLTPKEKLDYDLHYIAHRSFKMDFEIIMKTIKIVLTGDGAR